MKASHGPIVRRLTLVPVTLGVLLALSLGGTVSTATHTEAVFIEPIELIFGGSLPQAATTVLLIPPTHGDLGNPLSGPDFQDYLDATLAGIRRWEAALDEFATDYPAYSYLSDITVTIQIFDGAQVIADYDVVIAYVESGGGVFRGVATNCLDFVSFGPRCIGLSLFSNSPRAHQTIPDYPEVNDLHAVTMHEFAHTFGLGHTLTRWGAGTYEFDLMNSPATFVYGDGDPIGDGGERTPAQCISSLDLYGMAVLYGWLPDGVWEGSEGFVWLPDSIPYELYC